MPIEYKNAIQLHLTIQKCVQSNQTYSLFTNQDVSDM